MMVRIIHRVIKTFSGEIGDNRNEWINEHMFVHMEE
jgi:hypothetical protein